ncbi:MAG: histidine kinase [Bacteroidota bacterium]
MKKRNQNWNKIGKPLFLFLFLGLTAYWGWQVRESLILQYAGEWGQLGGFLRWLMGYVFILAGLLLLGWLNFRGPYQWWQVKRGGKWLYRSWMLTLLFILYQLLQWSTSFQADLVEENLLIASLCLLFIGGFVSIAALIQNRNQQTRLLQVQTAAELKALRAQLNPHFLFNALNTIYSQAVPLADQSLAEHIQELSGILRFSLQQAQKEFVPIREELTFLQRYIALQEARLARPEQLQVWIEWDETSGQIPPLLLLPFIENLFKYGFSSIEHEPAKLELLIEENELSFYAENNVSTTEQPSTGKGIEQVRRRLALCYPDAHSLDIVSGEGTFKLRLQISLGRGRKDVEEQGNQKRYQ